MSGAPPPLAGDVAALRLSVAPLAPETTVEEAAERLLRPEHAALLCLPILRGQQVIGTISRHALNQVFLRRFGRELLGAKPVTAIANADPLVVRIDERLDAAVASVTSRLERPLTEDFVIVDADGRYLGMGIVLDLLEALRHRAAQAAAQLANAYTQLKRQQTALVQSEKMASLGQMVAGVAHEINTPLGYVRNNVEMLRDLVADLHEQLRGFHQLGRLLTAESPDESALRRQLLALEPALALPPTGAEDDAAIFEDTLFGIDQIRDLVVNLRNFSRLDQARTEQVSLNDCIDQTLTIAQHQLKGRVEVIVRKGELPPVRCSPSQINQVLLNLITNAVQAIEHDQGKLLIKSEADADWVRVSVQDNGKGIAPEHLKRVFDPFFTTKPVGQGTGLGLSISFQIMEAHGGKLEVASKVGVGTRFVLSLPIRSADA